MSSPAEAALAQRRLEARVESTLLRRWVDDDQVLAEMIDAVVVSAGDLAQQVAVELYDTDRAANRVRGAYVAEAPGVAPAEAYGLVHWARDEAVTEQTFRSLVLGAVQHKLADASRAVILHNSARDPRARGWQRQVHSDCTFCRVIASNGAVFTRETATFAAHDRCTCSAVCVWDNRPLPVKPWDEAKSQRARIDAMPESTDEERAAKTAAARRLKREQAYVRKWVKANPDAIADPGAFALQRMTR